MEITRRSLLGGAVAALGMGVARAAGQPPLPAPAARDEELAYLTITEAARRFRSRTLSPVELLEALLRRHARIEPRVHAFISVQAEAALEAARAAERELQRGEVRGPLHGIPVGLKDNENVAGVPTTAASPILRDSVAGSDSTVAARLKRAGAIVLGKTALPEFSFGGHTPGTHNPWDLSRTAGGSSGGSGAALAAGLVLGATGGDTSGSIRNPASTNGVVGMKATYGRVSLRGIVPIAWSLDHAGPMSRSVADNALLLEVLAGHDPDDPLSSPEPAPPFTQALEQGIAGLRVGIPGAGWISGAHPDVLAAFAEACRVLEGLGAQVVEVALPEILDVAGGAQRVIRIVEAASWHARFLGRPSPGYGESNVQRDVDAGSLITAQQYLKAQKVRRRVVRDMSAVFAGIDVFASPGMPGPAGERTSERQNFRSLFNLLGFPALVLPAGFSSSPPGLPLGLQLAAKPFEEVALYRAGSAYESATDWSSRRPPLATG